MAAFSTTDEAVLTAPLELDPLAQSATASSSGRSIYYVYDVLSTAAKIHSGRFRRVALQFPDEALCDSVPVYWALKNEVRSLYAADTAATAASTSKTSNTLPEFYILADTSYGGCCVDEVAAKHVDADLVVHYGHACLSATARLPVIYVFTKQPLADVQAAAKSLAEQAKGLVDRGNCVNEDGEQIKALVLTYDVSWDHVVQDVFEETKQALIEQGVDLPLVRTCVDFRRNYDDKLMDGKSTAADQGSQRACCGGANSNANGCACASTEQKSAACCGTGSCSSSGPSSSCAKATSTASTFQTSPAALALTQTSHQTAYLGHSVPLVSQLFPLESLTRNAHTSISAPSPYRSPTSSSPSAPPHHSSHTTRSRPPAALKPARPTDSS